MSLDESFDRIWDECAEGGVCDVRDSAEYHRVRYEWEEFQRDSLVAFIAASANLIPQDRAAQLGRNDVAGDGIDLEQLGREIGELPQEPQ